MQSLQKSYGVLRPHEDFANQKIPYSGAKEPLDIGPGVNPALGNQDLAGTGPAGKAYRGRNVGFEGRQIPVVYADQARPGLYGSFELTFIMRLNKGVQTDVRAQ
jgi:hypothetical protein